MKHEKEEKILDLVQTGYNDIAPEFDLTRKKEIWPKTRELSQEVKGGDKILDLACGNGRLLEALKHKKVKYLGIDNSDKLIEIAKVNYPGYKFITGDMLFLDKAVNDTDKYNYIFCLAALQHIPSRNLRLQVLRSIKKHLEDDGKVFISNWNLWSSKKRNKLIIHNIKKLFGLSKLDFNDLIFSWKNSKGEKTGERYYHAFTKRELMSLAKEAGFKNIKIEEDKYNYWLILKN